MVEVINTPTGFTAANNGQITGAPLTTLQAASLATFTLPVGNPLSLSSDVSLTSNGSYSAGSANAVAKVNGTPVTSDTVTPSSQGHLPVTGSVPNPSGYTFTDQLNLTNYNSGISNVTFGGSAGVTAVPAPSGLLLLVSAVPALGWLRRRKVKAENV